MNFTTFATLYCVNELCPLTDMTNEHHHLFVMSSSLFAFSSNDDDLQSCVAEERVCCFEDPCTYHRLY